MPSWEHGKIQASSPSLDCPRKTGDARFLEPSCPNRPSVRGLLPGVLLLADCLLFRPLKMFLKTKNLPSSEIVPFNHPNSKRTFGLYFCGARLNHVFLVWFS